MTPPQTAQAPEASTAANARPAGKNSSSETKLHKTKNDLPLETRTKMVKLLNARLADLGDLQTQTKQAHWNVKGPHFIALHKLFDDIYAAVGEYVDLTAERLVQLGGTAMGTARLTAANSTLPEYPHDIYDGAAHVDALSTALATAGAHIRKAISEGEDADDPDTVDVLTEISRGLDQWLWFVEAHNQH
ncbi:MAG TPA: DNA starvation/stationary phase protection protein Dps [Pirellulales bacterium]